MRGPRYWLMAGLVLSLVGWLACSSDHHVTGYNPTRVQGSGVVVSQTRTVGAFDALLFAAKGELHLDQGAPISLVIEAEDNLQPYLHGQVRSGVLELTSTPGFTLDNTKPIRIYLTAPDLDDVQLSGVGSVDCVGMSANDLQLTVTGVGEIDFSDVTIDTLDALLTGVGGLTVDGDATSQTVELTGVGSYDGRDLTTLSATVTVSGVGSATVRVSDVLDVTVNSTGSVYYIGNPIVNATYNGSGSVVQIPG